MSFFDRMLLSLYSLGILVLSLIVGLTTIGWTTPINLYRNALLTQDQRIAIGVVAIVFLVISLKFFINSVGTKNVSPQAVVSESDLGQVRITVQALENLVKKTVLQVRGIREVKPRIISTPEGVGVFIHIIVAPDLEIPRASDEIQEKVKSNLIQIAGVNVQSVKILVDNISTDTKVKDRVS